MTIIDHNHPSYAHVRSAKKSGQYNGAYYYSREIVKLIIPQVRTHRNWITVNRYKVGCDNAIVFIHNNLHPENYNWMNQYNDLVLVCGVSETCEKVAHLGKTIYLPLSVDVSEVEKYKTEEKTLDTAFAGRRSKHKDIELPDGINYLEEMPRAAMLEGMARYKRVYAVGRTAIEAKILGCEILPYDLRYPDVDRWQILDSRDAAVILQSKLDEIDG